MLDRRTRIFLDILVHLTLLTLIGYSAWFWFERLLYVDSALQVFEWLQYDRLIPQQGYRWPAMVPQLVARLFRSFDADLRTVAIAASVAYAVWPYLLYLFTRYVLKGYLSAAMMGLAAVLFARHTFYEMVLETQLLAFYPLVLLGWMESGARWGGRWAGVLILLLCLMVHPIGLVAAICIVALGYVVFALPRRTLILFVAMGVMWSLARFLLVPVSGYESDLYGDLLLALGSPSQWLALPQVENFIDHAGRASITYLPGIGLAACAIALLSMGRRWKVLALFLLVALGYFALISLTYYKGESAVMIEKNLIFLGTWVAAVFLWALATAQASATVRWAGMGVVLLVTGMKVRDISLVGRMYTARAESIRSLAEEGRPIGNKFIVSDTLLDARGISVNWALPYETLLASSMNGGPSVIFLEALQDPDPFEADEYEVVLPVNDWRMEQRTRNGRYFRCGPGRYRRFVTIPQ